VERRASFPTPFARGRSERAFGTLQDRLPKELKLAAVTDIKAANAFIPDIYLPEHNARFAVDPAGEGSAFTPIPGVDLDEILCVEEERQVGQDNCVSYRTLKLQIPESPMRPHFVKARVKVHVYPDGSHAVFHGPRCIGRYDKNGAIKDSHDEKRAAKSARRRGLWKWGQGIRLAHSPTAEQNQKKRTNHLLPKPDKFIRYRQRPAAYFLRNRGRIAWCWISLCAPRHRDIFRMIRRAVNLGRGG
jgi:hypothetical protein